MITLNTFGVRSIRIWVSWDRLKLIYLWALGWPFSLALVYHILIIEPSSRKTEKTQYYQVLQNKAAHIILDLPLRASYSDTVAKLHWEPLMCRRAVHCAIFCLQINNLFSHVSKLSFNCDLHYYNTWSWNNVTKTSAKRRWGHWTSNTFAANEWNSLDLSLREAASLSSFKRNPSTVTLKVPVNK